MIRFVLACLMLLPFGGAASAQSAGRYPTNPVRILATTPPGGTADVLARLLAAQLSERLGGTFIVENRPGASGAIASTAAARATPDGLTLLFAAVNTHAILPNLAKDLQYDHVKDFAPIALVSYSPNLLLVHPSVPAKSVQELVTLLKANPDKYNYASGGVGSSQHLSMAILLNATGTKMMHVPFSGGSGQISPALIANTVSVGFDVMTTSIPQVRGGTLRALGISSKERSAAAPDIPAIAETVPDFDVVAWNAMFAPAGTPPEIVDRLSKTIGEILRSPEVVKRLSELGTTPVGSTPAELAAVIQRDTKKFGDALAGAGVERR